MGTNRSERCECCAGAGAGGEKYDTVLHRVVLPEGRCCGNVQNLLRTVPQISSPLGKIHSTGISMAAPSADQSAYRSSSMAETNSLYSLDFNTQKSVQPVQRKKHMCPPPQTCKVISPSSTPLQRLPVEPASRITAEHPSSCMTPSLAKSCLATNTITAPWGFQLYRSQLSMPRHWPHEDPGKHCVCRPGLSKSERFHSEYGAGNPG
jgi:hypothetical protein